MADMNVNNVIPGLGSNTSSSGTGAAQSLGQQDFLELMIAQLQNQDPMAPMENGEFLGQMAQFSTVSGISDLQGSVDTLTGVFSSSQLLDASSLIGREVMIMSTTLEGGDARAAAVELSSGGPVSVRIQNAAGELVQTLSLGTRSAGMVDFQIPELPAGIYSVQAVVGEGSGARQVDVLVADKIRGVTLDRSGGATTLELAQRGSLSLSDVRHIREETL